MTTAPPTSWVGNEIRMRGEPGDAARDLGAGNADAPLPWKFRKPRVEMVLGDWPTYALLDEQPEGWRLRTYLKCDEPGAPLFPKEHTFATFDDAKSAAEKWWRTQAT